MIDNVKIYSLFLFCFICLFFIEEFRVLHFESQRDKYLNDVKVLSQNIELQNLAINKMKNEAEKQASNLAIAEKHAAKERAIYDKKFKKLLNQSVPLQCDAAMQWGAEHGFDIYECWVVNC